MSPENKWDLESLLSLVGWMAFSLAAVWSVEILVQQGLGPKRLPEGSTPWLVLATLRLHGPILLGTGIFLLTRKISLNAAFGFCKSPIWRAVALGVLATVLFLPIGEGLQILSTKALSHAGFHPAQQEALDLFDKASTSFGRGYLAFFAILFAPLAEEIIFRGVIYGALRDFGFPKTAFWLSALLFALIHESLQIFLPIFVLGLILAWLYNKTGNLLSSIAAHAAFNGLNVLLYFNQDRIEHFLGKTPFHLR